MSKYDRYVTVGHRADGTRIRKHIKADTIAEYNTLLERARHEADLALNSCTFEDYSKRWLKVYKSNREYNTQEYYSTALSNVSALNPMQMDAVTRTDVQKIIKQYWEHPRTCKKIKDTLKQIFDAAIADGIVQKHPVAGIHMPPKKSSDKRILSDEELRKIKDALPSLPDRERLFVEFSIYLGLRPEETKALNKDCFDFNNETVDIFSAVTYDPYKPIIKDTKNHRHRTLPMPKELTASVKAFVSQNEGFFLFTRNNSQLMTKSEYRWFCDRIFDKCINPLIDDDITFYTFRHTRGTQLYYLTQRPDGISTKLAAWYMGHSESMFLSVYSHIDKSKENFDLLR